jgi:hypothetical protein
MIATVSAVLLSVTAFSSHRVSFQKLGGERHCGPTAIASQSVIAALYGRFRRLHATAAIPAAALGHIPIVLGRIE